MSFKTHSSSAIVHFHSQLYRQNQETCKYLAVKGSKYSGSLQEAKSENAADKGQLLYIQNYSIYSQQITVGMFVLVTKDTGKCMRFPKYKPTTLLFLLMWTVTPFAQK